MLETMYILLLGKFKDKIIAWDHFIEFLAVDNSGHLIFQLNHKFEWLFEDKQLLKSIKNIYNSTLLNSDYYDHLGEMYQEKILTQKQSQSKFLSMDEAFSKAEATIKKTDSPIKILDTCVGSGRYLMAIYKINPNAVLFGVGKDLRALRIAYTNFAIHGIRGYLLHADTLLHEINLDIDAGKYNWEFSNKWHSCQDKLRIKNQTLKVS